MLHPRLMVETDYPARVIDAVAALADDQPVAWLDDSLAEGGRLPGYSLLGVRAIATIEQSAGQLATLRVGDRIVETQPSAHSLLANTHARLPRCERWPLGLAPGWIGYLGFEAGRLFESLPARTPRAGAFPLARFELFDEAIVLDHSARRAWLTAATDLREALGLRKRSPDSTREAWENACRAGPRAEEAAPLSTRVVDGSGRADFERIVARAIEYIRAGDIYQVNLARRVRVEGLSDATGLYAAMRARNPARFGALLRWQERAVLSVSPELFLSVRDGVVRTSPIKGTRPRHVDPTRDEASRRELLESAKDEAELTMITDLHRNDLGRVCAFGSVRVERARRLESHATVHHTVADVSGRLAPGRTALDALAASFPPGSVTGVPKIRAVEIIHELEPADRGVYTGAIGVVRLDGDLAMSVAIRTMQVRGDTGTVWSGGGIVAESSPAAEYDETSAKARSVLDALVPPSRAAVAPVRRGC